MSTSLRRNPKKHRPARGRLEALLDAAAAHYAAGRLAEAELAYTAAEGAAPDDARPTYSLAIIDIRLGRWTSALKRLRKAARIDPDLAAAHHNLGFVHQRLGAWSEAARAYGRALELDPDAAPARLNLAIALAAIGRIDEAVAQYRNLAEAPERRADALTRLALLAPKAVTDAEAEALRRLSRAPDGDEAALTGLQFALAEVLDARGEIDAAFDAYAAGNRLKRKTLAASGDDPADVAAANAAAARFVQARLTASVLAELGSPNASRAAPIFIVGMPRSGSTLIEQILASHSAVQGLGEGPVVAEVLESRFPYAGGAARPGHFRALADAYLATQKARGWDGRARLVDKTLENYLHVGVIALMFPRAVILHSVRDAADTGFACFRQLFVTGNETLYDQAEIGAEYVRYRQVMDHWALALRGRVVDVNYEALVETPEPSIRKLVTETCGLAWEPACLRFDRSARAVTTASGAQVRQPMFRTSLQRWRPYAHHLGPLLAALGPYAPKA